MTFVIMLDKMILIEICVHSDFEISQLENGIYFEGLE